MSKTVLITGGSKGIGFELAKLFAQDRYHIILVARKLDELEVAAMELRNNYGVEVRAVAKDLSNSTASEDIVRELQNDEIKIDVLVNNAGFGGYGNFWERDMQADIDMIEVNIASLVRLSRLLIPQMVKNGEGKILNVASTAAFQPGPLMAVYYATKAFVLSFSQAISNELKGTGVTVTALCPGPTSTNFDKRADLAGSMLFSSLAVMSSESVAKIGYSALLKGKPIVVAGVRNKVFAFMTRFVPRSVATSFARAAQEKR
jgi:short-subunit dehydrogenase